MSGNGKILKHGLYVIDMFVIVCTGLKMSFSCIYIGNNLPPAPSFLCLTMSKAIETIDEPLWDVSKYRES